MHPSLEPLVKKELNKLLAAKIIFPVRHTTWVANLVPIRKKLGDIRICIDFRNLNRASLKDNYHVPAMEQILQSVSGSAMLSLLDGAPMLMIRCLLDSSMLELHFSGPWILHSEA